MSHRAAALLAAAAIVLGVATAAAAGAEKVTTLYRNEVTSLDVMIALDQGYFADEGLEVEGLVWNGSNAMLPALAQNKIDFAISGGFGPAYVNLIQRGARVRLVRARSLHAKDHCGYAAYVARNELLDSGRLDSVASLRGLRISITRATDSLYFWRRLLAQGGLTLDDVETVELAIDVRALALSRGLVDVVELTEPRVTNAVKAGYGRVWRGLNQAIPDRQNTFLMYGPRLLDQRRDLGLRVLRALSRAIRLYGEEGKSDRIVAIVARHTKMDPEAARELCWPLWSSDGRIDPGGLADLQEWALEEGLIDAVVPASGLVDEGFLDALASPAE